MEGFFRYLGRKAGQTYVKGRWMYSSMFGSEEEALRAEHAVGKQLANSFMDSRPMAADHEGLHQLEEVGHQLVNRLTDDRRQFAFNVVIAGEVNAFAFPGGFIFATDRLLDLCETDADMLAFVLGHEIGHVILGHPFDKILANTSLDLVSKLGRTGGAVGQIARGVVTKFLQSSYSQENELEADKFGVQLAHSAAYDPSGAARFLERLKQHAAGDPEYFTYFSTHPSHDKRIQQVQHVRESLASGS